jgi:hypothetical protein
MTVPPAHRIPCGKAHFSISVAFDPGRTPLGFPEHYLGKTMA